MSNDHEYRTEDVTVSMQVFNELEGPLPLLIMDRPGSRISIEITWESAAFLVNAVDAALQAMETAKGHHQ